MMIVPSDKDYKLTKEIKKGKRQINPEFAGLSNWIKNEYKVEVLNIIYDVIDNIKKRPRLTIIFEFHRDELKFRDGYVGNFDIDKQRIIAKKFDEFVVSTEKIYNSKEMWVVFTSFEPIAKDEANSSVPEVEIKNLKINLANEDIWEISRSFSETTFFLYTDKQVKQYENSEMRKQWTQKYFDLLDKHNEFGYFKRDTFSINIDSKENFDINYQSNWFYYYRRRKR